MFSRRVWRVAGRKAAGVCLLLAAMLVVLLSLPAALGPIDDHCLRAAGFCSFYRRAMDGCPAHLQRHLEAPFLARAF